MLLLIHCILVSHCVLGFYARFVLCLFTTEPSFSLWSVIVAFSTIYAFVEKLDFFKFLITRSFYCNHYFIQQSPIYLLLALYFSAASLEHGPTRAVWILA